MSLSRRRIPNLMRFEAEKVLGTPDGGLAPFYLIAEPWFGSADELAAVMATLGGRAVGGDVANFPAGGATLIIAQVYRPQSGIHRGLG